MSGRSRNFVFAYAFLVVLPLIGLAGVLKSGRHLAAPRTIDGLWTFQIDAGDRDGCGSALAAIPDKVISISQSGKSFVLTVTSEPEFGAIGTLEGDALRAAFTARQSSLQRCPGPAQLSLVAKVERGTNSSTIIGQLSDLSCSSCAALPFRAARREEAPSKAAR